MEFPAKFFVRFFDNHGMLNVNDRPQWLTIKGGSVNYVKKLTASFASKIKLNEKIQSIDRKSDHVIIQFQDRTEKFDWVFFACHSDEALKLIKNPTQDEKSILKAIPYTDNEVILHYDESFKYSCPSVSDIQYEYIAKSNYKRTDFSDIKSARKN
jgi:predicted NAD/FAD-binding protein